MGFCICTMLKEQLSNIHMFAAQCHMQRRFILVEAPSIYVLGALDD
jgi:hypothetical protein